MTDAATITVRREGAATTIVLDRPEALNAWNRRLGEELLAALREAAADDAVRAVRLTGAGRAFSAGADLRDVSSAAHEQTAGGHPDVGGSCASAPPRSSSSSARCPSRCSPP